MKKIALLIPGLSAGGAERVMSVLANEFSAYNKVNIHLILYIKPDVFYKLDNKISIHKVNFNYKKYPRLLYTFKIFVFLRKTFKEIKPDSFLSFGGKYNSLVLLSAWGLGIKGFISDRSRPGIKYGLVPDLINPFVYQWAHGIVAQTKAAKEFIYSKTHHQNIKVIPNPVLRIKHQPIQRENIILNVGRFIKTKNQEELIRIFIDINRKDWTLILIGSGPKLDHCKTIVEKAGFSDKIIFVGNTKDVESYYQRSKVFAFTSTSEGFPNVLVEAMSAGCACISYDCIAGPDSIIQDGKNGFLVNLHDNKIYSERLNMLMLDEDLREKFEKEGLKSRILFSENVIGERYYRFLVS